MIQRMLRLEYFLKKLHSRWPKPLSKEIQNLFKSAKAALKELEQAPDGHAAFSKERYFDFVKLINEILKAHDLLFLNRHLTYHVVTTSDLPKAFGDLPEALAVVTELLATAAKHASFGSRLEIGMKKVELREGPAIEVKFIFEGKALTEADRQRILEQFYAKHLERDGGGARIAYAKASLKRAGGQLWLEFPKETHVALTFNWPAFDVLQKKVKTSFGTYKFDIAIGDYPKIRQRFGIERARKLVLFLEDFVKSLVRHPVDMVIAFPAQGMMTVIYDAQEGTAASVSSRISQRLNKESFRLGRKKVSPKFRYQLSFLT